MIASLKFNILMTLTMIILSACSYSPSKSERAAKEKTSSEVSALFSELQHLVPEMRIAKLPDNNIGEFYLNGNYVTNDSNIHATLVSDKSGEELCDIFYKYLKQNGWNTRDETACKVRRIDNYLHRSLMAKMDYSPESNQSFGIDIHTSDYLDSRKSALITKKTRIEIYISRSHDTSRDRECFPESGIERCRDGEWGRRMLRAHD